MSAAICVALFATGFSLGVHFGYRRRGLDATHGVPRWASRRELRCDLALAVVSVGLACAVLAGWLP